MMHKPQLNIFQLFLRILIIKKHFFIDFFTKINYIGSDKHLKAKLGKDLNPQNTENAKQIQLQCRINIFAILST